MYAMLGDVRFETLQSFASLEAQHSAKFAKHEVLKGRPRLQAMENDLTTLRFGLKLHWMLGNPDTAYKGLLAALEAQQAVSLVYGSGRFVGWFVIESLTERTLIQDSKGRTAARELDVELTEFVGDPNNPLPTPAIISGKQNPLLSLLPESVQAQAADVMQAVETGVKVIVIVSVAPAAIVAGKLVTVNSPLEGVADEMLRAAVPEFFSVKFFVTVDASAVDPKSRVPDADWMLWPRSL